MRMLTPFFSISHGATAVSLRKPAAQSRSRRSEQLSAACACFQSDVRCKQRWPGHNKSFCGGAIANQWHPKDKHQNGTCVQCDLHRFLWSLADPRRKHAEKRKPFALFSNASLISDPRNYWICACFKTNLHLTLTAWTDSTLAGQNKSQHCQGSSTRLSPGFGSQIWRQDLSEGWGRAIVTPLWASARVASLRLQLQRTAASV